MAKYDYVKAVVCKSSLFQEVEASAIVTTLTNVAWSEPDSLSIVFDGTLSGGDETILDGIVTAHDGTPLTEYSRYCNNCFAYIETLGLSEPTICTRCGATDIIESSSSASRSIFDFYAYNISSDAGTFNSIACSAATGSMLLDRWSFKAFTSAVNDSSVCFVNVNPCKQFNFGKDIKVLIKGSYFDITGGDLVLGCGITFDTTSFLGDDGTTYQSTVNTVPANTNWDIWEKEFTISSSIVSTNDPFSIIIYRNTESVEGNTLASTFYINTIHIYQEA